LLTLRNFDSRASSVEEQFRFHRRQPLEVHVNQPYLLARQPSALPSPSPRSRPRPPRLLASDPAVRAMNDFLNDPPCTIGEDAGVEEVMDRMFRLGVRAFLVVHDRSVVGLITAEDARAAREARRLQRRPTELRASELMTPSQDVPAIDWQTLQDSRISDLLEIFEGSGVRYLVVLQTETATWCTVRGLIHRGRLERQLRG
jgi:CBS domain-containing protein